MSKKDKPFIIVCGCPRSGTYLLSSQLIKLGIALPVETHYIHLFHKFLFLWGDLSKRKNRQHLLASVKMFIKILYKGQKLKNSEALTHASILESLVNIDIDAFDSYESFNNLVFSTYAKSINMAHHGDKVAVFKPVSLNIYQRSLPPMKVIHIVRDGRDVCLSWRKTWFGPKSLGRAALLWREQVQSYQSWVEKNPDDYMELRYEDFIADPDATLLKVGEFVGVTKIEVNHKNELFLEAMKDHAELKNVSKRIDPSNTKKWKKEMPQQDVDVFEALVGDELEKHGYELTGGTVMTKAQRLKHLLYMHLRIFTSLNSYKRLIKNNLPAFLWFVTLPDRFR